MSHKKPKKKRNSKLLAARRTVKQERAIAEIHFLRRAAAVCPEVAESAMVDLMAGFEAGESQRFGNSDLQDFRRFFGPMFRGRL